MKFALKLIALLALGLVFLANAGLTEILSGAATCQFSPKRFKASSSSSSAGQKRPTQAQECDAEDEDPRAVAYMRTSSSGNVGEDKSSRTRQ